MELAAPQKKQAIEGQKRDSAQIAFPARSWEANRTEVQFFGPARSVRIMRLTVRLMLNWYASPSLAEAPRQEIAALRERFHPSPFTSRLH